MSGATWAAALWLLACLARDSSEALTTFGKTNPSNPSPPKPTPPPGRECAREADCAGIEGTSCVTDPNDHRLRCLCGDNISPINGKCNAKVKGLKHSCSATTDCMEGMVCLMPNATSKAGNKQVSTTKMCLCNEEEGFEERDNYCSDAVIHNSISAAILLGAVVSTWLRRETSF